MIIIHIYYIYTPTFNNELNFVGMRFAMMELKVTFSTILRNYKLLPADPYVPLHLNIDVTLVSKTGVNMRFTKRKQ